MDSFRFESWPWLFFLPWLIGLVWYRCSNRFRSSVVFSSIADLKGIPRTPMQRLRSLLPVVYAIGLCLILIALARPQAGKSESRIRGEGIAIELVLDVSGSMDAIDFQLNGEDVDRLTAVKHVVGEFVQGSSKRGLGGRKDDLVGVVAFAGFADSKCPLTLDHGALIDIVKGLDVPRAIRDRQGRILNQQALNEEQGTAIGDGVALGCERLRESKAKSRVMVLLTDGDNNAGAVDPREAASIAKELGIKLYTIGIGRSGVVPMPQEDELGRRVLVPAQFRIDEELLRELATVTGGIYFHASDAESLSKVYAQIDKLEKSQFEELKYSQYSELFHWFAATGLGLILLVNILWETRFRSIP